MISYINSPNIGKYRELKKITEKYWKKENIENYKILLMTIKKIKIEKILFQVINNFKNIIIGDFSMYDSILDISCLINSVDYNKIIKKKEYFFFARGNNKIIPQKMTKFFNTNYHYIIPNNYNNLKLNSNLFINDLLFFLKNGIKTTITIIGPISYLFLSINQKHNFKKLFEIYLLIIKKINNLKNFNFQFEEPILCLKLNNNWKKLFLIFYNNLNLNFSINSIFEINLNNISLLKKIYLNINIITNYIFNEKNFFFAIENNLNKINILYLIKNIKNNNLSITNCKFLPYNLNIEKFFNKKYLSFFFQKINELKLLNKLLIKKINSYDLLYLINFKIYKKKILLETNINKIEKKNNKYNNKIFINNTIGSFPQNKEIKISRKQKKFFLINKIEYNNILKENIYLCFLKQIKFNYKILTHGELERTDMVEYFSKNIKGIDITLNGWVQSYGTRYVKPPIILNIENGNNITENWFFFSNSITKKKIKIILTGPITILKWSFFNEKIKFFYCLKLSNIINLEILNLQKKFNIFQIDEPTIKECLPINKNNWKLEINNFLFCFNNCTKFIKKNNEIHSHICYSLFDDVINFIKKININTLTIESTRENFNNLKIFKLINLNLGAGIYDVHSPVIINKYNLKKNFFNFLKIINPIKSLINPDCGLKTRNWYELNHSLININKILISIKNNF
ncbi:5-methyltetrahydropteroyltriglutamate--homocysteine S-methyltransferase [Candidatus Carsonella ruddii]|uniref:5-methyltetrahydropteroyltriglutamate--homocysteine S-methyltransferase n=1 Tax=Candidatus Carsonella ruddii HC isolate Thao2000 TaxID=1202538 RepID=J3Z105_CARRU|nr:5-methyltetrahydropteroyltriglutamate--homocysteine S-methyltransferase [Candidatus Carsonella ruddii]AFP83879.1 5-methyltetrahydropteroyltriglutamate-- homocysteine S-methyltransferase [Candidatus Carsonella ruddii HC isolate Thao2000]